MTRRRSSRASPWPASSACSGSWGISPNVMATASRGHGLMLRLQQLEAEFPAVEKALVSQTEHSNYPHDDGVNWHANLQLKQNMITQGDMPRFILDSYEECRGPPHLFTLDKFDVAGAGASLKRYSDPSFFKTESNMLEMDVSIEKKPRRVKKKAMRWRKGATLESLLIENSEYHITPKDRTSRKVPPRTTKLKSRHPRSPDHKTISRICREHLLDVISSQQKILSAYSGQQYHVKFRSSDSSEMENYGAIVQSSGKLELTKIVPINESDTMETISAPTHGSPYLELGDKQIPGKQHEPLGKNGMVSDSGKLQDCPNFQVGESNHSSHSGDEERHILTGVPADQDANGCRPDDICSDQDNFIDALNNMDSDGEADPEIETEPDPSANVERTEMNCDSKEGEDALHAESPEVGSAIDSSPGFNSLCLVGEPTCTDLPSDYAPPAVSATNGPSSGSQFGRQLNGVDWTKDEEPFDDEDLMDVSSSSSVASDNADLQTNEDLYGCQQHQEEAYHYQSGDHTAVIHSSDKHSPKTSSVLLDGMVISSNDYTDKVYHSAEHGQDDTSMVLSNPNDVSEDEDKPSFGIADDLFLHPTKPNQEEIQEIEKELEEGGSLDTDTSTGILASWPDMDRVMCMNDVEMNKDSVTVPEEIDADTAPTCLDHDDSHDHQDGIAPEHSGTCNNLPRELNSDEIAEDMHSLPDNGLSTRFNKDIAEDNQIVVLEGGAFPTSLSTHKEGSVQASAMARDFSDVQEFAVVIQGVPSQEETEAHAGETLAPESCVFNDDTEPVEISVLLAPSTSSLPDNSSSCVEQHALTEMKDIEEGSKVVVAEESTTSRFADDVVPPKEEFSDAALYTEKTEVLTTNSTEEASRHDLQLQSSSPLKEGLETVEATHRNLGEVDTSRECISKKSMLQIDNIPFCEIEPIGEKCSDRDGIQFPSSAHFPVESDYQEELLEEASHNAEGLSLCDLYKDGAVSLKSNTMEKQPENVDQDSAWGMPDQDSSSTNPFMDPAYMMSHTQFYPSPSMIGQPCFPEEQDFPSELLIQHGRMGAAVDSLWEPATPPDEAPLPSEVMTEEDFRSFFHEYHEIGFSAGTEGCHSEPASESNNISNAMVSESDFPCSLSALPVNLDQEACVHSKFGSQCAECSSTMDIQGATSMTFSGKEDLNDEAPGVDSHLKSHASFSDNRSPELDILSVPVDLQQEQHLLSQVDSHSFPLSDKEKTNGESCFPSSNVIEVKQDLEIHAGLVPHSFINENVEDLDVVVQVEPEVGARALDEYDNQDIPCCSTSEKNDTLTLGKPVLVQGSEVCALGEFGSPLVPSSSIDEIEDNLEASALRTSFRAEQESECCTSGEHDSQITISPLLDEKIDELDGPALSNTAIVDKESEVCVPCGLNSRITPCSSTEENIQELDHSPLSSSVLVDLESEDNVSGDCDSEVTPCSLVIDKVGESEDVQPTRIFSEQEQEAHASPELDFHVAPCSLNDDKVGEIEGPLACNGQVGPDKESDCSTEFNSQTVPCSSNSPVLTDTSALASTPVMETYQLSPGPPPAVQSQNDSYEDPQAQAPPPLPPLQWRLGRPRLGLLSGKGSMPEPARRINPVLQASRQDMDIRLGLLDRMDRSIEPVSSQAIKEDTNRSSLLDDNDQNVEFGRSSTSVVVTDVARTEHCWQFSEASENIKHQGNVWSSSPGVDDRADAGVAPATADDSGATYGIALSSLNPVFPLPTDEQQGPHLCILSSDSRENSGIGKSMDAAGDMESISIKGHDSENRCYQQPEYVESFSGTSDHEEHITNASEEGGKHLSSASEAISDPEKHSAPGTLLNEGNSQESQHLQEQNMDSFEHDRSGGPLPSSESMAPQDYPHDEYNLDRENRHRPSNPGPLAAWPGDKSNFFSGLDEASFGHAEQPPVLGWTVGPQMIHPKYGISVQDSFEQNITDNHLIKKPISIKNIPRNPLVDAVAAHDRSSMRKVSELAPSTDKPKPNERNLLLEQIRNKTFSLKPVAPAKPIAMGSPARANTRNLKVAAIIEKANAIRQAVGSDDEDADSWSDA
ncbi:hypothetical protein GQ55_9G033300 [Panicum hallii var. hallii]|uniref:WH2 domain-containing protein n=1 Tax=Panicum hallii var. hallii TaxID=1504633 RepID=A0A2T7BZ62_9POAL|nr:hypothetical protein GQ55_9G033300 [Panicum hallii var. hallii]